MGTLVRLRIALADRPGALAKVATIIAGHRGNITSIDVQRAGVISAIDDMLVDLPDDVDMNRLRNDLTESGAATLLSHQAAQATDPVVSALRRAAQMLEATANEPEAELVRSVAELCQSPVVWISSTADATRYEAGRFALERGGAIAVRTEDLPEDMADRLPGESWLLAVPDPHITTGRVVFVARSLANEFTTTEIARIEALMALHDQVERRLMHPSGGARSPSAR